eukprot:gb/GECH01001269.1/.p1 GENE.gb/GECH01001269.1/~~gb/GECH01001269.1/.p1  ORF type:complete len:128 (+),score=34.34 gb/GECH01001269.1/:1-384(+)
MSEDSHYIMYRESSIGEALKDTLEDMEKGERIDKNISDIVLNNFDQVMNRTLTEDVSSKVNFKGKCEIYRCVENVYVFILKDANFQMDNETLPLGNNDNYVKIVACEAKQETTKKQPRKKSSKGRQK